MEKLYEKNYHTLEERYWWFIKRRRVIQMLLERLDVSKDADILDVGCASGVMMDELKHAGFESVKGIEVSEDAIGRCLEKGLNVYRVTDETVPLEENSLDVIIASDVLEHIENDEAAVAEWFRVLRDGGVVIAFVPAHPALWSSHDETNFHFRRYGLRDFSQLFLNVGLNCEQKGYWNFGSLLPASIKAFVERVMPPKSGLNDHLSDKESFVGTLINGVLSTMVTVDNFMLIKRIPVVAGLSAFVVMRKSESGEK